jgi:hypothetical protein
MPSVRPNVLQDPPLPASLGAASLAGAPPQMRASSAGVRPLLAGELQTSYIASLLQRELPAPDVAPPSESLSAYKVRDLLQSRANHLAKLRGDRGGAEGGLAVAHNVVQWQLRARDAGRPAAGKDDEGAPQPTIAEVAAQYGSTSNRANAAVAAQSLSAALKDGAWRAFRHAQRQAAAAEIQGRRRPQTAYYERPAVYANNVQGQLATLQQRLARRGRGDGGQGAGEPAGAPGGGADHGEGAGAGAGGGGGGGGGAPASPAGAPPGSPGGSGAGAGAGAAAAHGAHSAAALAALLADPHAVVGAPHRVALPKRITQPVVLRPSTAPVGGGAGAGKAAAAARARRAPLVDWWLAPAAAGGGGGPAPAIPPSSAAAFHASPTAAVLAAAGRLLERFQKDGEEDAARVVAAAARLGVPVAGGGGEGEGGGGGGGGGAGAGAGAAQPRAVKLPPLSDLAHALRPATSAGARRGGGGDAAARPSSAKAPPPPPPPPPAGEGEGEEVPPHPPQFIGGLYSMHPLDAEAQREDLRQRILRDLAKAAKAAAAAAKGGDAGKK